MSQDLPDKDKKDWDAFLASNEKLKDKDQREFKINSLQIKSLDLHGYTLEEANKKVAEFINNSYLNKVKKLIIVTGKGLHSNNYENPYVSKDLSILKYSVPEYIKSSTTTVFDFCIFNLNNFFHYIGIIFYKVWHRIF